MTQRRRTKRKRKASSSTMRRRMGLTGWGNSKPFFGWSKTLTTKTLGEGHNPGVLNGAKFTLPVNNWNDPLGDLGNLVPGSGSLTKTVIPRTTTTRSRSATNACKCSHGKQKSS